MHILMHQTTFTNCAVMFGKERAKCKAVMCEEPHITIKVALLPSPGLFRELSFKDIMYGS